MQDKTVQTKLLLDDCSDNDKYYLGYSNILCNNPFFKAKIFEFFDYDIKRVFALDKQDLENFSKVYSGVSIPRNFLSDIKSIDLDKIYENSKDADFITYESELYPKSLKNIEDFPTLLYYKGNLADINFEKTLAVVGSRTATEGAKQNTSKIISGFLNTDAVIISGLASGIDACAHKAALQNNLKTVAVIGSGLNFKYPASNAKLYDEIEQNGVIFSEFPNTMPPKPANFPQRNRIVTGLSKGVLIAEAKKKSGAMISARFTLEQGKELMCIPGLITNPNCEGIYHLIKNGASVVTDTQDILNILNWQITAQTKKKPKLTGLDKKIYDIVSSEEISIEGLKQKLNVGINELMVKLTEMELFGLIIQKNGLYYILGN